MRWLAASSLALLVGVALQAATTTVTAQDPEETQDPPSEETAPPEVAPPQDTAPKPAAKDAGWGAIFIEIDDWIAQPAGLEYRAATLLHPEDPLGTSVVSVGQSTEPAFYIRGGFGLRNEIGDIVLTYYRHSEDRHLEALTPGSFLYGEINTSGFFAGVNLDGLADGFAADTRTRLRDFRADFYRSAFESKRTSGRWFVGYRDVSHDRQLAADYFAIAPNLPPIIPPAVSPRPDLEPKADTSDVSSTFQGRGLEAGLDVQFKVWRDTVWFETGLGLAVLRGEMATSYTSVTHFYGFVENNEVVAVVLPPYELFNLCEIDGCPIVDSIAQIATPVGIQDASQSEDANVIETDLALHFKFWKTAEFVAGFRSISYTNVGQELRPGEVELETSLVIDDFGLDGSPILRLNAQTLERTAHSVDYEGFYFGLAIRF